MAKENLVELATGNIVYVNADSTNRPQFGGPQQYIKGDVPVGEELYKWVPFTLAEQKSEVLQAKLAEIKQAYSGSLVSFLTSKGITMNASESHVRTFKDGYDLAVSLSETNMDIVDHANVIHASIPLADVGIMLTELKTNIRTQFFNYQTKRTTVSLATTIAKINAVAW